MHLNEIDPTLQEALLCQRALRRLGFSPEHLYVNLSLTGDVGVAVCFDPNDEPVFVERVGTFKGTFDLFRSLWAQAAQCWNGTSEDEQHYFWLRGGGSLGMPGLVAALQAADVEIPAFPGDPPDGGGFLFSSGRYLPPVMAVHPDGTVR